MFKYGNVVSNYLEAVKLEQSKAHVPVRQAKPLFLDKWKPISDHITTSLTEGSLSFGIRFVLLRDMSFFTLQFFAGDRASDLGQCLTQEIKALPERSGFLVRHTSGKALGEVKVMSLSSLQ